MATKTGITVKKRVSKVVKKNPTFVFEDVKTDGTAAGAAKAIETLTIQGVSYFEMLDPNTNTKTAFKKMLSGQSYEVKTSKIN